MTPSDFSTALTTLGLDNHQAAQWLGVSVKSVRRYRVSGAPGPVAGMVRLALKMQRLCNEDIHVPDWIMGQSCFVPISDLALDWRE